MLPRTAKAASRAGAARGATAGAAGALLTIAAAAAWTPRLLAGVVGPPPVPSALAAASLAAAAAAGALLGRRLARTGGGTAARVGRAALWTAGAYVAAVAAAVAGVTVADQGPVTLVSPFGLAAYGVAVALLLLPWAALPVLGVAIVLERWTRAAAPSVRGHPAPGVEPGADASLPPRRP